MTRVLLIEGDSRVRQLVQGGLGTRGFTVTAAPDGPSAVESLRTCPVDVVLLDPALPDRSGRALLATIQAARPRLPVISLTARGGERFSAAGLAAQIRAQLRLRDDGAALIEVGALALDLARHRASIGGSSAMLSARETSLLAAFMRHAGEVLSRDQLLRQVWEIEFDPGSNVVDVYVGALRRKLGAHVIETIRGRGYRLPVP
jgi:DNA-binding response OmpR family regulator